MLKVVLKTVVWFISYLSTFLLVVLIIKLINRACLIEKFTDSLIELWDKLIKLGSKGVDAIKSKRGGPPKPDVPKLPAPKPPKIKPPKVKK